jgi:hypothetical protein
MRATCSPQRLWHRPGKQPANNQEERVVLVLGAGCWLVDQSGECDNGPIVVLASLLRRLGKERLEQVDIQENSPQ